MTIVDLIEAETPAGIVVSLWEDLESGTMTLQIGCTTITFDKEEMVDVIKTLTTGKLDKRRNKK